MTTPSSDKLAVLIDADNAQAAIASELLAEVARYGTATVKRAYGDWTTPNLAGWKETLHNLAIHESSPPTAVKGSFGGERTAAPERGQRQLAGQRHLKPSAGRRFQPRTADRKHTRVMLPCDLVTRWQPAARPATCVSA